MCSPGPQDEGSCADLNDFISRENEKCVRQIKESNDRRIGALEESLSFASDSIKAMSDRQHSADIDIRELQRETAELRRRLRQMELSEDRQQQEKRLTSLVFSGPQLQALTRREDAARLIHSVVQQYLHLPLDSSQVMDMLRLKNGKILIHFTTAARGSDRDTLFRAKTKLRGSGLFIAESLTPRRQAMLADLLQLKDQSVIASVFTRSGDIFACRTRDSEPIRIADPEAVQQLYGAGSPDRPPQGRARPESGGGARPSRDYGREERRRGEREDTPAGPSRGPEPETRNSETRNGRGRPDSAPGRRERRRDEGETTSTGRSIVSRDLEMLNPNQDETPVRSQRSSCRSPLRRDPGDRPVRAGPCGGSQPGCSLLDCALDDGIRRVQLSPPLPAAPASAASSAAKGFGGGGSGCRGGGGEPTGAAAALTGSASPVGQPAVAPSPVADDPEAWPPLPTTADGSPALQTAAASGKRGERRRDNVRDRSPARPPSKRPEKLSGAGSKRRGAGDKVGKPALSQGDAQSGTVKGLGSGGSDGGKTVPGNRDIRDYF